MLLSASSSCESRKTMRRSASRSTVPSAETTGEPQRATIAECAGEPGSTVRLFIDRNDSTPARGLTVEVWRPRELTARYLELDPQVVSLDIRYLSGHLGVREWSTSWVSSTVLPLAAEVKLSSAVADSLAELLRVPILIPIHTR